MRRIVVSTLAGLAATVAFATVIGSSATAGPAALAVTATISATSAVQPATTVPAGEAGHFGHVGDPGHPGEAGHERGEVGNYGEVGHRGEVGHHGEAGHDGHEGPDGSRAGRPVQRQGRPGERGAGAHQLRHLDVPRGGPGSAAGRAGRALHAGLQPERAVLRDGLHRVRQRRRALVVQRSVLRPAGRLPAQHPGPRGRPCVRIPAHRQLRDAQLVTGRRLAGALPRARSQLRRALRRRGLGLLRGLEGIRPQQPGHSDQPPVHGRRRPIGHGPDRVAGSTGDGHARSGVRTPDRA